jgi:hypothetical protein
VRNLLYVPIIHEAADLGSISSAADEKGRDALGAIGWERHKEIVKSFWKQISHYFEEIDAAGLEIFQDGLPVGGEIGLKIIREGAKKGSSNYGIVLDLINRGGVVKKTEDIELLQKELVRTKQLTGKDSHGKAGTDAFQDLSSSDQLMTDRDRCVAHNISETLEKRGVLFMGALHHVPVYLDKDIEVVELKKIEKVQAYFKTLYSEGPREILAALSAYMVSPIKPSPLKIPDPS